MAFCITLSTAATKTAYQRFGDAYISALSQAVPGLNMEQCQAILSDVIGTVGQADPDLPPRLHFEMRPRDGVAVDPLEWLRGRR